MVEWIFRERPFCLFVSHGIGCVTWQLLHCTVSAEKNNKKESARYYGLFQVRTYQKLSIKMSLKY